MTMDDTLNEYRLDHLTWSQARAAFETARVGVIPLGATEQHGPHLRMAVDYRIAERLAEETVAAAEGLAVMTPPLPVGFSPYHMPFPGTLTARSSTLEALLDDVITSLMTHGLRRFVIWNGHGGNLAFLPAYVSQARDRLDCEIAVCHWSLLGRDVVVDIARSEVFGHACEVETSMAMALAPELIVEDQVGGPASIQPSAHPLLKGYAMLPERAVGAFSPVRSFAEVTPNGALGNPREANLEAGQRLATTVIERAVDLIRHLAESERPADPATADLPDGW